MKTLLPIRIKGAFAVLVLFLAFCANLIAQPQYYNYQNVGSSSNSFPFGQAAGKAVNWLFLAGDFTQPTPAPAGNITKVYFFISSAGTRTFTNMRILMAQTNLTTLTTGQFYPGPWDTVYFQASPTHTGALNDWMGVTLDTPYPYNPAMSLVVFVEQCGATGSGLSVRQNTLTNIRRVWSVGGCPYVPFAGGDASIVNFGVDIAPAASLPDLLYYKFERNPTPLSVINCGTPGVGTPIGILGAGTPLGSGGQFDSCITGTNLTTGKITTGWNCNLGTSSWTISMWLTIPTSTSGSAFYLFGDAGSGSFRCFHNGVAGQDNLIIRGTGITDVTVTGIGPNPTVVTIVYDSAAAQVRAYKNGVLAVTVPQTLNITTGTGFHVGGYGTSPSFGGKMDEFRMYRRALGQAEISATWNTDIGDCELVPVTGNNNEVPMRYSLEQNYPNPFNPTTKINFSIPKSNMVDLRVYDVLGREVAVLVNSNVVAGNHSVSFDASSLATGVYFYTLVSGDFRETKKMLLVK
jgi:hypothetical protein